MNVGFPFHLDSRGRVASPQHEPHVRQLIEQLLFTVPGERVNRPRLGTGILELIFASTSGEQVTATEYLVQGALQQWLGELIELESVQVTAEDAVLTVQVKYKVRRSGTRETATFEQQGLPWHR
jgi:phage baseplate assembly protein W